MILDQGFIRHTPPVFYFNPFIGRNQKKECHSEKSK